MNGASTRWLAIIGIGEDGVEGLSPAARALLQGAKLVAGGARHLALADGLTAGERLPWPSPISAAFPRILAQRGQPVVVLASGDPYCYGIGATLARFVPAEEMICHPAPSSFSLACARLGWVMQEVTTLSFCGHDPCLLLPHLQPGARILALSADETTPAIIAALLRRHGFGASRMHVLEALGGPRERIRTLAAEAGLPADINRLNLVALEIIAAADARVIPLSAGLPDEFFEHDGQITRRELRSLTLSSLAPRQGETLWDVGCASGSIGIEWMLRHPANRAIGIECNGERAARASRNAIALGVPGLRVITGQAPEALHDLPAPDAVFIGGGGRDTDVIHAAWNALRPGGRLVANAVTVETEAVLLDAQHRFGGALLRVGIEHLDTIGRMRAFRPAISVTHYVARKP